MTVTPAHNTKFKLDISVYDQQIPVSLNSQANENIATIRDSISPKISILRRTPEEERRFNDLNQFCIRTYVPIPILH